MRTKKEIQHVIDELKKEQKEALEARRYWSQSNHAQKIQALEWVLGNDEHF